MAAGSPPAGSNPPVSEATVGARCSRLRLLPTSPLRPRSPAAPPSRPTPLRDGAATPLPEANRDRHLRKASSRARVPNLGLQVKRHKTLVSYFAPASASGRQVNQNQPPQDSQGQATGETGASNVAEQQDSHALDPEPEDIITSPAQETVETRSTNANAEQQNSDGVHVRDPEVIIADPGLRKPIEEMHPNDKDDAKREYILLGPCQPKGHKYPRRIIGNRPRSFHEEWYKNHDWLEYSVAKDTVFCFYCYLFKPLRPDFAAESFTKNGFNGWKDGPKLLNDHATTISHKKARKDYDSYKNQRQSVGYAMSSGSNKKDEKYRARMIIILGVARFLLLQAHAFRGHDETESSTNKGNFLEMLRWYKEKDKKAAELFSSAAKNSQMTCHKIQKDLCKACAQQTTKAIIEDIGDRQFSVLVDESRDASIKEQMAVVLRYVNGKGQVIERFLGVQYVADTTSTSLNEALDGMFAKHGLSMSKLRGQGYDGASNMRGEFHGLQRRILDENPYAFYIHCFAHQLQLVVVSVAKSCSSVFDFFNLTTLIVNTVNASCKRRDQLSQAHHENIVSQLESGKIFTGRGQHQQTNLARPGDTRWGSHHKTLCRLLHMWDSVLEVLENVAEDGIGEKRSTASGLLKQMESAEFVLILHLMISLLGKTNDLSQCLQRKDQNIVRAVGLIGTTLEILNDTREHGWEDLFDDVKNFCVQHRIIIPNMEDTITVRGRSRGRGGQEVTYYHHLKHEIFNVVHDQIIVELNNRFAERSTQLLRCIACLDPRNSFANFNKDKLIELAQIYADDFSQYDCVLLRDQLGNFIGEVRTDPNFTSCTDLGNLAVKMVQTDRHEAFPLVYRLIELALILPVATATVERAFSAMNIIKTELRSKMGNEWLNHRMVCYIERGVFASIKDDDILLHFQELKSRREHLPKQLPASGPVNIVDEHTEPRMN